MIRKVLVPLDGSKVAEGILPYISQIARRLRLPMVLLSVVDPGDLVIPQPEPRGGTWMENVGGIKGPVIMRQALSPEKPPVTTHEMEPPYAAQFFERTELKVRKRMQPLVDSLAKDGVAAQLAVSFGHPAEEILRVAEAKGCDLIAMSTRGRNVLARGILGSVTDKVIHASPVPVLTISPSRAKDYWKADEVISRALVPLDGSPLAESVLPYVEYLAKGLGLKVLLTRVVPTYGAYAAVGTALSREAQDQAMSVASQYLDGVARRLQAQGLEVEQVPLKGAPAREILQLARRTPQDIIILATHGYSGLRRWVLGSVTEAVVRASGDPVLVLPPGAGRSATEM